MMTKKMLPICVLILAFNLLSCQKKEAETQEGPCDGYEYRYEHQEWAFNKVPFDANNDSLEGGYQLYFVKLLMEELTCTQGEVTPAITIEMTSSQIRPITVRAYMEISAIDSPTYEVIPLDENEGMWTSDLSMVIPLEPHSKGYSNCQITIYVDFLVPKGENFWDDYQYLLQNGISVNMGCSHWAWSHK